MATKSIINTTDTSSWSSPNRGDSAVHRRGAEVHKAIVALNIASADVVSGGDAVPIMELPAEAIVTSIKVTNAVLDSGTNAEFDIGIYAIPKAVDYLYQYTDGAVNASVVSQMAETGNIKDADIYVDGTDEFQETANDIPTELLGSGTNAVSNDDIFKTVRELAGDAFNAVPFLYVLGLKATTAQVNGATAGNVVFEVEYVQS